LLIFDTVLAAFSLQYGCTNAPPCYVDTYIASLVLFGIGMRSQRSKHCFLTPLFSVIHCPSHTNITLHNFPIFVTPFSRYASY